MRGWWWEISRRIVEREREREERQREYIVNVSKSYGMFLGTDGDSIRIFGVCKSLAVVCFESILVLFMP